MLKKTAIAILMFGAALAAVPASMSAQDYRGGDHASPYQNRQRDRRDVGNQYARDYRRDDMRYQGRFDRDRYDDHGRYNDHDRDDYRRF